MSYRHGLLTLGIRVDDMLPRKRNICAFLIWLPRNKKKFTDFLLDNNYGDEMNFVISFWITRMIMATQDLVCSYRKYFERKILICVFCCDCYGFSIFFIHLIILELRKDTD